MRTLTLVALQDMRLDGSLGRGIQLAGGQFLTNDPAVVAPLVDAYFERVAGALESDALRTAKAAVYSQGEEADDFSHETGRRILGSRLQGLQSFLSMLWLVKDNSVNFELGFLYRQSPSAGRVSVTSNSRSVRFATATGEFNANDWSATEARLARDYQMSLFGDMLPDADSITAARVIPRDFSRIERVLYYLQGARNASDLGNKVAAYVTCFEALFCTDPAEIAHKLSERVAYFCGRSAQSRLQIFRDMKDAYTIRSKTVHGDRVPPGLGERAHQLSLSLDSWLRETLSAIVNTPATRSRFLAAPADLESYLTRLTLSATDAE